MTGAAGNLEPDFGTINLDADYTTDANNQSDQTTSQGEGEYWWFQNRDWLPTDEMFSRKICNCKGACPGLEMRSRISGDNFRPARPFAAMTWPEAEGQVQGQVMVSHHVKDCGPKVQPFTGEFNANGRAVGH